MDAAYTGDVIFPRSYSVKEDTPHDQGYRSVPAEFQDELTELLRAGARHLLMQAVEVERWSWSIFWQNTSMSEN